MATAPTSRTRRVFVVLNPVAGSCTADDVRQALGRYFPGELATAEVHLPPCEIHETNRGESIPDLAREAVAKGCDLVVAAGGDGTVSAVANGLVGTTTPLGIIPLGTANVLARELGIPVDLDAACALLAGAQALKSIDAMRVDDRCYFTQVGVGIDSMMIRDTTRETKRRFGRVAYLWTAAVQLFGFQPREFALRIDGAEVRNRASQVLVANCGILGQPPFRWGPDIRPDDGRLDVCILRARTLWDYLKLSWYVVIGRHKSSPHARYMKAERLIRIGTRRPLPVQADGEIIGETPVEVSAVPRAVGVVVPPIDTASA